MKRRVSYLLICISSVFLLIIFFKFRAKYAKIKHTKKNKCNKNQSKNPKNLNTSYIRKQRSKFLDEAPASENKNEKRTWSFGTGDLQQQRVSALAKGRRRTTRAGPKRNRLRAPTATVEKAAITKTPSKTLILMNESSNRANL